jgi:hypothetical protein
MNAQEFVTLVSQLNKQGQPFSLGTIDPNYKTGKPRVIFDGETTPSSKTYPYVNGYTPVAGERVVLANIGGTHVILGGIQNSNNIGGWIDLTNSLVNGFTDYSSSSWSEVGAQKIGDTVYLSGLVVPPASLSGVTTILTLPAGYAPKNRQRLFGCPYNKSSTMGIAQVNVYPDGQVTVSTSAVAGAGWLSLDPIHYVINSNKV